MSTSEKSNVERMRELIEFETIYSCLAKQVILKMSFRDSLARHGFEPENFPDITTTLSVPAAKALIAELQSDVDAIEAGKDHTPLKYLI